MAKVLGRAWDEPTKAVITVGIVKALRGDLTDGYLETFPELIRGEMFENLNEMARHLLEEGYKDAAAVIAGTSFESHLYRLAIKYSVVVNNTLRPMAPSSIRKPSS